MVRVSLVVVGATLIGARTEAVAQAQPECTVTSTFLGRWNRVDVRCGTQAAGEPRAAAVVAAALQECPLLAGDRVAVAYENNDSRRRPDVTDVALRGNGGASSGDWCNRGLPPGLYIGPCIIEERPPMAARSDSVGATSWRRSVVTWVRDTHDGRRSMAGTRCAPVDLGPGIYRVYIEENIRSGTWKPGPTYYADRRTIEDTQWTTNRYEGGIYIDGGLSRSDSVTDLASFVRGWGVPPVNATAATPPVAGPTTATAAAPAVAPPFQPITISTAPIAMTGLLVRPVTVTTGPLSMAGLWSPPIRLVTAPLGMRGLRHQPVTILTQRLAMKGARP